jgi:hypothetical protein
MSVGNLQCKVTEVGVGISVYPRLPIVFNFGRTLDNINAGNLMCEGGKSVVSLVSVVNFRTSLTREILRNKSASLASTLLGLCVPNVFLLDCNIKYSLSAYTLCKSPR